MSETNQEKKTYSKPVLKSHPVKLGVYGNYNTPNDDDPYPKPSLDVGVNIRAHNDNI